MDVDRLAVRALDQATVTPDAARKLALHVLREAGLSRSVGAASVASRALGLAALQLRDISGAIDALRHSVKYAERSERRQLVGEARMSLAAALGVAGRGARAVREIELALRDLDGLAAARGLVQRAAILQDLGRYDEAFGDLRRALPSLRQSGDAQWEARARSNRSLMWIARRSFGAAEADLLAARRLCAENDMGLQGAYVEHNLGWLFANRQEIVRSLEHLALAEEAFRRLGMDVGSLYSDRAEVLLSVRLLEEAREAADAAIEVHRRQGRLLQVPEAQLLLSTIALVQGDTATAAVSASRAVRGFQRLSKGDGLALARYARLQAQIAIDSRAVSAARARRSAVELAATGWLVPAQEARIIAGLLELGAGHTAKAREDLAAAARARRTGPAEVRARAWFAEAQLRRAEGRRRAAKSAVAAGLHVIDSYQATMGATELRAHVSTHRDPLAALGLRMALEDASADRVLAFVERTRASALLRHPMTPPSDPGLSDQLADLRTTMTEIEEGRRSGRATHELTKRQVALEHSIADRVRRSARLPDSHSAATSEADLSEALGEMALVEFIELDAVMHAVSLVDGHARLHTLGSIEALQVSVAHLAFALRRLASLRTTEEGQLAALAVINKAAQLLDAAVMQPLAAVIQDRPLVLVPADPVQALPWSVLPSCTGRPVTVTPSARLWHRAACQSAVSAPGRVVVAAGPTLPGAVREAHAVADLYRDAVLLTGRQASASGLATAMNSASLVHVAAHGRLRADNPSFSSLLMADGPLTVYELERLNVAPRHVVLASCDAGRSQVVARDEVLGLSACLLGQGTTSLVAPVFSVADEATVPFITDYHTNLRSGRPPAYALAAAQAAVAQHNPREWAAAAPFVCLGAGHSRFAHGVHALGSTAASSAPPRINLEKLYSDPLPSHHQNKTTTTSVVP